MIENDANGSCRQRCVDVWDNDADDADDTCKSACGFGSADCKSCSSLIKDYASEYNDVRGL